MMMKATTMAVTAILLLGGLYLYMNRFEYLHLTEGMSAEVYLRINKLTEEECLVWKGRKGHQEGTLEFVQENFDITFCPNT